MAALGENLLVTVNKLQDLVFNTIGNDSLDLPQIVSFISSHQTTPVEIYHTNYLTRSLLAPNRLENPLFWKI
jgi:hypothetical protein